LSPVGGTGAAGAFPLRPSSHTYSGAAVFSDASSSCLPRLTYSIA
jgi:hypothetical protein